ncbi:MAG TPA: COX15/CtaA family protein [Steroidobacteraceae bacterium]|jgi:cytochrome c oxidase assembly protein subunit 15|nr:COX15/CtaA family protein [Steroidobacteraceae bacterium]
MHHALLVRRLALLAALLCLGVVVLGAYVRLSNAGLGCPDWPGCYGHLSPVGAAADQRTQLAPLDGQPLQVGKAWREMVHRYAAGTLVFLIVLLMALGVTWRSERVLPVAYVMGLLGIVVLQAALGMLTVTWQLTPIVVTLHLLFGLTTLSLLWWLTFTLWGARTHEGAWPAGGTGRSAGLVAARTLAAIGLMVLACQIALGGWTSSNYAALACPDLPTCQGSFWPAANFHAGFTLWHPLHVDYEGGVLANPARVAIQLTHRLGAVVTSVMLLIAASVSLRPGVPEAGRRAALWVMLALALQLAIGVSMVLRGFPLWLATAHNAGAALLLLATLALNRALTPRPAAAHGHP